MQPADLDLKKQLGKMHNPEEDIRFSSLVKRIQEKARVKPVAQKTLLDFKKAGFAIMRKLD